MSELNSPCFNRSTWQMELLHEIIVYCVYKGLRTVIQATWNCGGGIDSDDDDDDDGDDLK